jgi:hypothetical protein
VRIILMYAIDRGGLHYDAARRVLLPLGSEHSMCRRRQAVFQATRGADRSYT